MQTATNVKINALDTLRGFAALSVFVYHFHSIFTTTSLPNWMETVWGAGHVGLDIFFVLSGFLIFRSLYFHGINKQYFLRRFLRIAPIYYFSLVLVLLFIDQSYFFSSAGWNNIISHLFFIQSFSSKTYYGINPVLWSLSVELIFYFFLPVFFLICKTSTKRILLGILFMIGICYWYRFKITAYYSHWDTTQRIIYTENFFGRLDQFAFGMLASLAIIKAHAIKSQNFKRILPIISSVFMAIGGLGIILGMVIFNELQAGFRDIVMLQVFLHSAVGLSSAFIIFGLSTTFQSVSSIIGNKIFVFFGTISYSFYIWHLIIIEKIKELSETHDLFGNEFYISFIVTLLFSAMTYFLIENSFLAKKDYSPVLVQNRLQNSKKSRKEIPLY